MDFTLLKRFMKYGLIAALLFTIVIDTYAIDQIDQESVNQPHHSSSIVQSELVERIECFLENTVPGMDVSYRSVIDAIIAEGHDIFLKGGFIRDLVNEKSIEPKDIDLVFSGTQEQLIEILKYHCWRYSCLPGAKVVVIGDHRGQFMEFVTVDHGMPANEYSLEFTVNNIFYHINSKSFLEQFDIGIQDLHFSRINIVTNDWATWLYGDRVNNTFGKLFRFWKMVGKGYVYSKKMEDFFRNEATKLMLQDEDKFQHASIRYLSSHYSSFKEVSNGCQAIMGREWCERYVLSVKREAKAMDEYRNCLRDRFTHYSSPSAVRNLDLLTSMH